MIIYPEGEYEYASTRLIGTLVFCGGRVVEVREFLGDGYVSILDVASGDVKSVPMDELDLTNPKLGFVNLRGEAHYIVRAPMRRDWRQGIRYNNLVALNAGTSVSRIPYRNLAKTMLGDYPRIRSILRRTKEFHSIAWDRSWALSNNRDLLYKNKGVVGNITEEGRPVLSEAFSYLQESLDEVYQEQMRG